MREDAWYKEHGFLVCRELLDSRLTTMLARHVDRIHRQWLEQNRETMIADNLVNVHSLTRPEYFASDPAARIEFFSCVCQPRLTALLEALVGEDLYFHNTQLFFDPPDPSSTPHWHRDLQYSDIDERVQAQMQPDIVSLHIRVPLASERGLELVPGTHRRWDTELESQVRTGRGGHVPSESLPGAVLLALDVADVAVFHGQMLHRGCYGSGTGRKALDICVGFPRPAITRFLDPRVLPNAAEMTKIPNNGWYRRARDIALRVPQP